MDNPAEARRCSESCKDGAPCRGRPVNGGTACPAHGGRDPGMDPEARAAQLLASVAAAPRGDGEAFLAAAAAWESPVHP